MHPRRASGLSLVVALIAASVFVASAPSASSSHADAIPPYSLELERRVQPWCPGECVNLIPFTATYRKSGHVLVFVGTFHVFTPRNPTIRAVDFGFSTAKPKMVIVEGIPTAMGESPAPLIEQSKTRDTAQALSYTKGEGMYAITLALAHTIPFVGGEPTREQEIQALERKGFAPPDIAFNYHLGSISQAIRSGELANAHDPKLMQAFDDSARAYVDQFKLEPLSFADFTARYRSIFGIDFADDSQLHYRSDPSTANPVARLAQTSMISRDEHLLATIEDAIAVKKQVLVVYGGSHWTTLSHALEKRFGKPAVRPFAE